MKKVLIAADFYFLVPFLLLCLFYSSESGNVEIGILIMLTALSVLTGLKFFDEDFSKKTYIKHHEILCVCLSVFEDFFYLVFFIGLWYALGISFMPQIGR